MLFEAGRRKKKNVTDGEADIEGADGEALSAKPKSLYRFPSFCITILDNHSCCGKASTIVNMMEQM